MRKLLSVVLLATTTVGGCGGGGGSGSNAPEPEKINGLLVPATPNPTTNASTLAGVDANGNGLRDDIERKLATDLGSSTTDYAAAVDHAKTLQAAIVAPTASAAAAHLAIVNCMTSTRRLHAREMTIATTDTPERKAAYGAAFAGSVLSKEGCAK